MVTQRNVSVKLNFFGTVSNWSGVKSEDLEVVENFTACLEMVDKRVKELTGGKVLYSILYNGSAVSTIDPLPDAAREGDVFTIVPVILGG